jgi:hypothetical protein
MEKVRRDECAEDQNRHRNERNRDEQGLGIGSEYEPPSKDELLQIAKQPCYIRSKIAHCTSLFLTMQESCMSYIKRGRPKPATVQTTSGLQQRPPEELKLKQSL